MLNKLLIIVFFSLSLGLAFPEYMIAQRLELPSLPELGKNDTILMPIIPMDDEWVGYRSLVPIEIYTSISMERYIQWLRLEKAVRAVYPYAKEAGKRILYFRKALDSLQTQKDKRHYLKKKEKDIIKNFTAPMKKLSMYEGGVLIKLINRESGNTCYELIKEYKGGVTAIFWETVARFFHNSLKEKYEPESNITDYNIELLVRQLEAETVH